MGYGSRGLRFEGVYLFSLRYPTTYEYKAYFLHSSSWLLSVILRS